MTDTPERKLTWRQLVQSVEKMNVEGDVEAAQMIFQALQEQDVNLDSNIDKLTGPLTLNTMINKITEEVSAAQVEVIDLAITTLLTTYQAFVGPIAD